MSPADNSLETALVSEAAFLESIASEVLLAENDRDRADVARKIAGRLRASGFEQEASRVMTWLSVYNDELDLDLEDEDEDEDEDEFDDVEDEFDDFDDVDDDDDVDDLDDEE